MPNKAAAFNIPLPTLACPRCQSVGLIEIDEAVFCGARGRDKHLTWPLQDPVLYARCERCFLVMGWPDGGRPAEPGLWRSPSVSD